MLWVESAQRDHADFRAELMDRDVDVVELHDVLAETVSVPGAATGCSTEDHAKEVGIGLVEDTRAFLDDPDPSTLDRLPDRRAVDRSTCRRTSGTTTCGWPARPGGVWEYLMPPLPNTLYTRDTTCWIYGGVTLNPLFCVARLDETLLMKAIYRSTPTSSAPNIWWGDPERPLGEAISRAATSATATAR